MVYSKSARGVRSKEEDPVSFVPLIGRVLSDPAAYRYLPRSVAYLPPPDEMVAMVARAGFAGVERRLLSGGIAQLVTATRRS